MDGKLRDIDTILALLKKEEIYPAFEKIERGANEPECDIAGKKYLMFSSNNYLGLTENRSVIKAGVNALKKFGVGPGGSRVISGNISIIVDLEKAIAELAKTSDSLTFPTGYMANVGIFSALMDSTMGELFGFDSGEHVNATIFSDESNHGSIIDGCRLSTAKKIIFKHNNFVDLLEKINQSDSRKKLIVTEGVFSLDGEIVNLPELVDIAKKTNSLLMIDDAHGIGILGENGGGVGEYFHLEKEIDVLMGCMDKAFGGTGGYLAGTQSMISYLRVSTRPSLLSSAIPTGMAGAMIESINQIISNKKRRLDLFKKAKYLKQGLKQIGFNILGNSDLPAIPLYLGDEKVGIEFEKEFLSAGIYCKLVRWPAVPLGTSRFRIIVMATHEYSHLDRFIEVAKGIGKNLSIIN